MVEFPLYKECGCPQKSIHDSATDQSFLQYLSNFSTHIEGHGHPSEINESMLNQSLN